jgi:hypothetical protein
VAVRLTHLVDEIVALADKGDLTDQEAAQWDRLVLEWERLQRRIEEGRN